MNGVNILLILLVFSIIVFFHELGHFIVAKMNHILVDEFSIGMGPAIFSWQKKETKYSVRLLPIGGYCMMHGESGEEDSDNENSFANKSILARMAVIAAGPIFNFILAFVFSIILIHFVGCDPTTLDIVMENSPAEEAGLKVGDRIAEINGDKVYNYRELLLFMQTADLSKSFELKMVTPEGEEYVTKVQPRKNDKGEYKIGVYAGYEKPDSIVTNIKYAILECRYCVKATVDGLKMIVTRQVKSDQIMGPVGVGGTMNDIIEDVKRESSSTSEAVINIILNMINWCILLSVNLGIMNLLPIPALDGGRLLFLLIEGVRRKKIPQDKEAFVNLIGFVLLIILMIVVFFNDIKNIL